MVDLVIPTRRQQMYYPGLAPSSLIGSVSRMGGSSGRKLLMEGGGAGSEHIPEAVLIDRTAGTNIGDMITGAGLAAAFDGNTSQAVGFCAQKGNAANAYVGKTLAAPKIFAQAIAYGANNNGFLSSDINVTLTMYGKTGAAPSAHNDGTSIGTLTFTDTGDESAGRPIDSTDLVNAWDHIWLSIVPSSGTPTYRCAELVLYEWI